jgi:hypothetical protein
MVVPSPRKHSASGWMPYLKNLFIFKLVSYGMKMWEHCRMALFSSTRGITCRYLSKTPAAPSLRCLDARCDRAKISYLPILTSVFNVEEYQISYDLAHVEEHQAPEWKLDKWTLNSSRVIPNLSHSTSYKLRARSRNFRGQSSWGEAIIVRTLEHPVDGGGTCPGYTWTQTGIEVSVHYSLPTSLTSKSLNVDVKPKQLRCTFASPSGGCATLVDAELPHRVRLLTPDGGSYWDLERQTDTLVLSIYLEKEKPAKNIKWGFWRSMFVGDPEVDTHAIESDPHVHPGSGMTPTSPRLGMQKGFRQEFEALRERVRNVRPESDALLADLGSHVNRLQ